MRLIVSTHSPTLPSLLPASTMLWQHRMALPERPPDMPPTIMESRVKGIQERALHTLVMRLTFRNIFFHGAVIFRGPLPKQGAQLDNTCFKRATQNPPGTWNASKVRKPNETWIIWGSATEPQIIKFHFNSWGLLRLTPLSPPPGPRKAGSNRKGAEKIDSSIDFFANPPLPLDS